MENCQQSRKGRIFDSHEKCVWICHDQCVWGPVGQLSGLEKNFNAAIFSDTIDVIDVKLCMMVLLIEFYLIIPCLNTLTL